MRETVKIVLAALIAGVLAGCGTGDSTGDDLPSLSGGIETDTTDLSTVSADDAALAFERCLVEAGVDLNAEDQDRSADEVEAERRAVEECQGLLDSGATAPDVQNEVEASDQLLEMQRCLAELGVESDFQNGSLVIDDAAGGDVVQSALEECS